MEDTSHAIHPNNEGCKNEKPFYDIGNVIDFSIHSNRVSLKCVNGFVNIMFVSERIVRLIMNPIRQPELTTTVAVVKNNLYFIHHVHEFGDIFLETQELIVVLSREPLRISIYDKSDGKAILEEGHNGIEINSKNEIICTKKMDAKDCFYGFGEKTGFLNKRGEKLVMWNSDVYDPHNPETDPLYQSIPFFITLRDGNAHGVFVDNSYKMEFDLQSSEEEYSISVEGGQLDYYVILGPTIKNVVQQYSEITGRIMLPPKWALGYQQSRYSYKTAEEVRLLVHRFEEEGIPLDAVYLDIHYMDGYRVFTFDTDRFQNPKALIGELKDKGIHTVTIVDPGVKVDPEYHIYQEGVLQDYFCKYIEGAIYQDEVWPGKSAFPDFPNKRVREWWGDKHEYLLNLGVAGIWNDMNEPAVFNDTKTMELDVVHNCDGDLKTHRELHNLYGLYMAQATYEGLKKLAPTKRPFLLTRAGYAGIQRYSAVWTGDTRSFWEHLQMSLPMLMNLGLSGVPFVGADVGGFAHDCSGELLVRWTQVGAFTPYFRNHCALESIHQEPWSFGSKYQTIIKAYIEERYKWLPYLYKLFQESTQNGLPIIRPLVMEYQEDPHTYNLYDQAMIGESVMIAPIMQPDKEYRVCYFPEGVWIDYWTGEKYIGNDYYMIHANLSTLPIFIKEGSIIPQGEVKSSTSALSDTIYFHIYPKVDTTIEYVHYEDDGQSFQYEQGEVYKLNISCRLKEETIYIDTTVNQNNYIPEWKEVQFIIHYPLKGKNVMLNGRIRYDEKVIILPKDKL